MLGRWQCVYSVVALKDVTAQKWSMKLAGPPRCHIFSLLKLSCERKDHIKDGKREMKEMKERNREYRRKERNAYQWEDPRDWNGTNDDDDDVSVQKDLSLHTHTQLWCLLKDYIKHWYHPTGTLRSEECAVSKHEHTTDVRPCDVSQTLLLCKLTLRPGGPNILDSLPAELAPHKDIHLTEQHQTFCSQEKLKYASSSNYYWWLHKDSSVLASVNIDTGSCSCWGPRFLIDF